MTTSASSRTGARTGVRTVAVPVELFAALQQGAADSGHPDAVDALRDAGYRAGQALFDGFAAWLAGRGERAPAELPHDAFTQRVSEYFGELGWGRLSFSSLSDAVLAIDAEGWAEAGAATGGCLLSTGLLSGFFGRVADAPVSVLEVECERDGDDACRFLLGSVDVLGYVHEAMERGIAYRSAAASA